MKSLPRLGIVGVSSRALAEAAASLGLHVEAIDAFGDQDTLDVARCQVVADWPRGIMAAARNVDCDGWLLAGGMEHHGRIVDQLALEAPLIGPSRAQLMHLRSLRTWRQLAAQVPGLAMPESSRCGAALVDGLYKPHRSSGGLHIADAASAAGAVSVANTSAAMRGYWQRRIAGRSLGVTALITDCGVRLCGATESLTAADWPGPRPYIYRGSAGPVQLSAAQQQVVLSMAETVGEQVGLRGWLQADFIEDVDGQLWLLEINPRWTAGMEVLHMCAKSPRASPLVGHLAAHALTLPPASAAQSAASQAAKLAKAVCYAPHPLLISRDQRIELQSFRSWQSAPGGGRWSIADVPAIGGPQELAVAAGQPLLTLRFAPSSEEGPWPQVRQEMLTALNFARQQLDLRFFSRSAEPTKRT